MHRTSRNSRVRASSILLLAAIIIALALTPPATRAAGTPTVFIAPATHVQPAVGVSFFMTVNVTGMPAFNGYNILVKVNTAAITITSISSEPDAWPALTVRV
ncbi:hypothetical protein E6H37_07395 [Candidatus Bathyarchaeota archaeon]|nr:MAG: hypothetical protein E6H37_07395 [Candidatus Bathyarchaeota archaeon]